MFFHSAFFRLPSAAVLTAALAFGVHTAHAQRPISLGVAGGVTVPRDRLESVAERGYHGLVTLRAGAPLVPFHARLDALHGRFGATGSSDGAFRVTAVTANVGYDVIPLPVAAIYVVGGGGWYWTEWEAPGSARARDTGWNAGAGIRLSLGSLRLFGEARYHTVGTADGTVHFIPLTVGIIF